MDQLKNEKIAFVGSGLIGTGIATNAIMAGYSVTLQTRRQLDLCKERMQANIKCLADKGIISGDQGNEALQRVTYTTSIEEAVLDAAFIQESGPENYETKWQLIDEIEKYTPLEAVIASSTSGLLITEIQKNAAHPERILGGHPYNPAYLIPLVEVTKGEKTSDKAASAACAYYAAMGKEPVTLHKEVVGFIANRLQMALYREAVDLVMTGVCSVEDVDKSLVFGPGIRWGILGQILITHLSAAPGGIITAAEKYKDSTAKRLAALADWKSVPEGWGATGQAGIENAIKNRPEWMGNDLDSIAKWRDDMLIELLKLHRKF